MFIIYNLLYLFILIFYFIPNFAIKKKYHKGFTQRLGFIPKDVIEEIRNRNNIWIHGVSVGEAIVACQLAKGIKSSINLSKNTKIIISTVTPTGKKIAEVKSDHETFIIYFPLDFSFIISKVIRIIKPDIFILVETELWPNIIRELHKQKVPIILANGRISDSSYAKYRYIVKLLGKMIRSVNLFCVQTVIDKSRLISLGANKQKVKVCGNIKFDVPEVASDKEKVETLKKWISLNNKDLIFLAGSTHPGEEEILIKVYEKIIKNHDNVKLIIAPRHVERTPQIKELLRKNNFKVGLFNKENSVQKAEKVFIMNEIGWLKILYSICDFTFIGGSLAKYGGHNVIEPALYSKPIIIGPYFFNFRSIVRQFIECNAIIEVFSEKDFYLECIKLIHDINYRNKLGNNAKKIVQKNQGATQKTIDLIKPFFKNCKV